MNELPGAQQWLRQVVRALPSIDWPALQQGPRPWLCLNGAHSEALESEVRAFTKRFDYRWVWRDTAMEYGAPGYRQGPLIVPLDEPLFVHALDHWLPQQAGLVLLGPDDADTLAGHLKGLHQLVGPDGQPVSFSLHAVRQLEELCEGLGPSRMAEIFGPMERLIWYAGDKREGEWLTAQNPRASDGGEELGGSPVLTVVDEEALDQASYAWFMRDVEREFNRRFPEYANAESQPLLVAHMATFAHEAQHQLAFSTERDIRHYMALRFQYPQDFFAKDTDLKAILVRREVAGRQRLLDAESRLAELAGLTP
ncbi:DUF4123 domain-containing protein [Achromobacter sp. NPDC058515]|uniref:DUF4123 domain-containing protein n=1 Tax=Achromobacter sp. NPDC058515 TaxID=3346533 RepID=UPI00365492BC